MSSNGLESFSSGQPYSTTSVPKLGEGFDEQSIEDGVRSGGESDSDGGVADENKKSKKRGLFGLLKKRADATGKEKNKSGLALSSQKPIKPMGTSMASAINPNHPYRTQSPNQNAHSSSPRMVSPAGSQIFERDVQESSLPLPSSPAIPSHIQTEDHIPSVLDASSEAITNETLDPDSVEIVMHSSHQPATFAVTGMGVSEPSKGSWSEDKPLHANREDHMTNYAALDHADVRRLSFISFADVVQSEHVEHSGGRDTIQVADLTSLSSGHRSPSPMRSPLSSPPLTTPPLTSKSGSLRETGQSPSAGARSSPSSPPASISNTGGDLMIETMSQALRKTRSGDLGAPRSLPGTGSSEGYDRMAS